MIKFFRKIRQNLLSEGKTGKYLKYAIGEIILVVIGILIALSINNWNETQKENYDESVLLNNLKDELVFNKSQFKKTEVSLNSCIKTLKALLELFGKNKETVNLRYLDSLLYKSFFSPQADISEGVFNSITKSGKIELLTNSKLKNMILSLESKLISFKSEEGNMYENLNRNLAPRMEERISFQNIEKFGGLKGIKDSKLITDNRNVLKDAVAENMFFNHLWELNNVLEFYPSIYELIDEIILELEKEIKITKAQQWL